MIFSQRFRRSPAPAALAVHAPITVPTVPATPKRAPPHDYAAEADTLVHYFDFTSDDVASSIAACRADAARAPVNRVAWFIPYFDSPYAGGIHTILRVAEHMLRTRGTTPIFVVIGPPDADTPRARIAEAFATLAAACEIVVLDRIDEVPELGPLDAAVATLWMTSLPVLFLRDVRRKLYLIQDWEPEFYPAGSVSELVRASYRFGYHAICNTAPLAEAYRDLGGTAEHFLPAVDPAIFHADRPARPVGDPFRVFCYARPGHPRNCFELAASALRDVKARLFDRVEILCAGADWDPAEHGLRGCARNVGVLGYAETGALYRSVDVGLCMMATRHPSYVALELMACGAAVVATRNAHTAWLLRDGETAFVADASRSEIADTILAALQAEPRRAAIAARGQAEVAGLAGWEQVCAQVAGLI